MHKCQTKASELIETKKSFLQIILMLICVSHPTLVAMGRVHRVVGPRERKQGACCVCPTVQARLEPNKHVQGIKRGVLEV